jgi:NADH dehydrogenase
MVTEIRDAVGSRTLIVPVPGGAIPLLAGALNLLLRDTLLTAAEYRSMAAGLADSAGQATGEIVLTDWIREHAGELGRRYANELDRHFRAPSRLMTQA